MGSTSHKCSYVMTRAEDSISWLYARCPTSSEKTSSLPQTWSKTLSILHEFSKLFYRQTTWDAWVCILYK